MRPCAPQKVEPALIAGFRPAMFGCFAVVSKKHKRTQDPCAALARSQAQTLSSDLMVYFKRAEFWHRTGGVTGRSTPCGCRRHAQEGSSVCPRAGHFDNNYCLTNIFQLSSRHSNDTLLRSVQFNSFRSPISQLCAKSVAGRMLSMAGSESPTIGHGVASVPGRTDFRLFSSSFQYDRRAKSSDELHSRSTREVLRPAKEPPLPQIQQ